MEKLKIDGISHHGEQKTLLIRQLEGQVLIDTEGSGDSGILLTKPKAETVGKFLQEIDVS